MAVARKPKTSRFGRAIRVPQCGPKILRVAPRILSRRQRRDSLASTSSTTVVFSVSNCGTPKTQVSNFLLTGGGWIRDGCNLDSVTLRVIHAQAVLAGQASRPCPTPTRRLDLKDDKHTFLGRISSVLNHARVVGMTVIHVQVGFRPGLPEVSSRNVLFGAIKSSSQHQKLFEAPIGAIPAAIAPKEGEIVVTKHRVSAFAGTDLAMILRANDIDTLVLLGIATSGVVLSTLAEADGDFRLAVIKDCCADLDSSLHDCLINKFFPSRAAVLSAREF